MATHTIVIDAAAAVLALIGFHMAFRQRAVRGLWRRLVPPPPGTPAPSSADPAHYALIISGMMLFAFALIFASFTTMLDILT